MLVMDFTTCFEEQIELLFTFADYVTCFLGIELQCLCFCELRKVGEPKKFIFKS